MKPVMKPVMMSDLTPFHRAQIIAKAKSWRMRNHPTVLKLIKESMKNDQDTCRPSDEPSGHNLFSPELWTGSNWIWFTDHVLLG